MIKNTLIIFLVFSFLVLRLSAQENYWQQQVNHTIDVTLNDTEHTLEGFEKVEYFNNSPDTLAFIWFHIWPNAYRNDKTAFSEQMLRLGRTDFYFSGKEERGYMNRLDFKVDGLAAEMMDHPQHIDIVQVMLPRPLPPHGSITITTPFHVQLPVNFSRGGHVRQSYQGTQWYPKPAVYDRFGWHPMPYLHLGEFYSEFGNYDVRITVPQNYVVAATGELQDAEEKKWLLERAADTLDPQPTVKISSKTTGKKPAVFPASAAGTKTLRYLQDKVHDFAWFADKRFRVRYDTMKLNSGRQIDVFSYCLPSGAGVWKNSLAFMKAAIRTRSEWLGEYPYNIVSAVEAPIGYNGGMEYPTITSISPLANEQDLELTLAHEIGHNWLYGILATNERAFPWMDEGMNTYYDNRYKELEKSPGAAQPVKGRKVPETGSMEGIFFESYARIKKDQPIQTASEDFTGKNYFMSSYFKAGEWMKKLETCLGKEQFDSGMHAYYNRWQFRHPSPEDFKAQMEAAGGKNLDLLFAELHRKGSLQPGAGRRSLNVAPIFKLNGDASKNYLFWSPAIGANLHDGFMPGAVLHNYQLPPSRFKFLVAPLYATGSKNLNGIVKAAYSWFPDKKIYRVDIGATASRFSMNDFRPEQQEKLFPAFRKLAPVIRVTFNGKNALDETQRYIQLKTFIINEDRLDFRQVIRGTDTSTEVNLLSKGFYLNQLKFVLDNPRVLYPYRGELQLEQHKEFIRLAFTGNYFLNYPDGKTGLDVRLFAGKFIYSGIKTPAKQFQTDRYHLNLTGANGHEDYTYSNYFAGRNKFDQWGSQQIMIRDGAFKVRTDMLGSKVGKTDNWLMALNLSTPIPDVIDILKVLPVKIPVKIFADVGTYAETWQKGAEGNRFLFDAGFQVSLFKETVNIYVPVIYSKVFRDYFRSTLGEKRFFKTMSFSIDIHPPSLKLRRASPLFFE